MSLVLLFSNNNSDEEDFLGTPFCLLNEKQGVLLLLMRLTALKSFVQERQCCGKGIMALVQLSLKPNIEVKILNMVPNDKNPIFSSVLLIEEVGWLNGDCFY